MCPKRRTQSCIARKKSCITRKNVHQTRKTCPKTRQDWLQNEPIVSKLRKKGSKTRKKGSKTRKKGSKTRKKSCITRNVVTKLSVFAERQVSGIWLVSALTSAQTVHFANTATQHNNATKHADGRARFKSRQQCNHHGVERRLDGQDSHTIENPCMWPKVRLCFRFSDVWH